MSLSYNLEFRHLQSPSLLLPAASSEYPTDSESLHPSLVTALASWCLAEHGPLVSSSERDLVTRIFLKQQSFLFVFQREYLAVIKQRSDPQQNQSLAFLSTVFLQDFHMPSPSQNSQGKDPSTFPGPRVPLNPLLLLIKTQNDGCGWKQGSSTSQDRICYLLEINPKSQWLHTTELISYSTQQRGLLGSVGTSD